MLEVRPRLKKAEIRVLVVNYLIEEEHLPESAFQMLWEDKSENVELQKLEIKALEL